ncbi:hypothetical protein KGP17_17250 [Serratia sp. JSRIV001]|uniref:Fe2OG dioxygenase domain-containing protein n=1 Tax=Serratia fonticola TaxID=47917 RepID=A0AAW3WUS5_SERFO|nr:MULTISPECIES: hypothetical protein [Serratia]MBC3214349.1 hypothetical protein [Serratia fonticola]NXZ86859.1 hypothetical protein [Serratia fonticola]NYA14959.1 hypothetical protein [Serratia fonticola]NYA34981.1 hypothetical protein [Serratia fonticola]QXN61065.1 hypothetical protein J8M99_17115 [Serratia fonticola]
MSLNRETITGERLFDSNFMVQGSVERLDLTWANQVLSGQLAAYRVRQFLSVEERTQIVKNFWCSKARTPRYGEGEGGIEGYFVGASHIEKTTQEYLDQVAFFKKPVDAIYEGSVDPLARVREGFRKESMNVRAAIHDGRPAGDAKAVYWNNTGDYLLLPHDDLAQLSDPSQHGFEIQGVEHVMAMNFYADMPSEGGQLKVWNIAPDNDSRIKLGLEYSGFPYPVELLHEHAHLTIDLEAGDLVLLNGNLVHAVLGGSGISARQRLLITCFMGQLPTGEVVWWT